MQKRYVEHRENLEHTYKGEGKIIFYSDEIVIKMNERKKLLKGEELKRYRNALEEAKELGYELGVYGEPGFYADKIRHALEEGRSYGPILEELRKRVEELEKEHKWLFDAFNSVKSKDNIKLLQKEER